MNGILSPRSSLRPAFDSVARISNCYRQRSTGNTYRVLVLDETLVEATQADQEQYTRHILETVNPLPTLALLATDVDHEHVVVAQGEDGLRDTNCPRASVDDVLLVRNVLWVE